MNGTNNPNLKQNSDSIALQRATGLLLVSNTPKGRGVFASQYISKGTILEVSPVLIFSPEEVEKHTAQTVLQHYTYYWPNPSNPKGPQTQAIALGLGSMFNHSRLHQNVVWSRDIASETITYTAHRDIKAGEELCISYGNARLWFQDADLEDESLGIEGEDELQRSGLHALALVESNDVP
ncbi:hypothetical protein PMZ80_002233 [Knufia obscura]|uniref:SET domain-containing protein n=2 Tax=Knufia TaxID=430999 RepID=A0AAN8ERE4_9EURO|nr:hypothetical protein PMZ80_002233 [Knufia obscura]KAK5950593.1 hypothetical protein OHC33_008259 [Knufia fluminis]